MSNPPLSSHGKLDKSVPLNLGPKNKELDIDINYNLTQLFCWDRGKAIRLKLTADTVFYKGIQHKDTNRQFSSLCQHRNSYINKDSYNVTDNTLTSHRSLLLTKMLHSPWLPFPSLYVSNVDLLCKDSLFLLLKSKFRMRYEKGCFQITPASLWTILPVTAGL